jgi:hypothetical protein
MSMQSVLDSYMAGALSSVHTALPGKVLSYDEVKHRAKVKPATRMLMDNGVKIELPELLDVPIIFPSAKSFDLEFPLDKDDGVLLIFQELDISEWKADESTPTAVTSSRFNLDSAIAIPGMFPKKQTGKARIYVDKNGILTWEAKKIVFKGQMVFEDDVIARKDVYVGAGVGPGVSMTQHIHPTAVGPTSPPTPATPIPPEEV